MNWTMANRHEWVVRGGAWFCPRCCVMVEPQRNGKLTSMEAWARKPRVGASVLRGKPLDKLRTCDEEILSAIHES